MLSFMQAIPALISITYYCRNVKFYFCGGEPLLVGEPPQAYRGGEPPQAHHVVSE